MKKTKVLLIMLIMVSLIFYSCSKDSTGPSNRKPEKPTVSSPKDGATWGATNIDLSWNCYDQDGDPLTFDVYFGTLSNLTLANPGQSSYTYNTGTLNYGTHYWKIVAYDDHDNSTTGDIWHFTTISGVTSTVTDIDGNVYQTIQIGDQEWMMENLKVTHYSNGDPIPEVTSNSTWCGLNYGAYCNYDNELVNVATYGRLYNWFAVDDSRGISPEGWHVPTDDEWQTLVDYLGGSSVAGGKMKETGTIHWNSPNHGATNESCFTALPGGFRNFDFGDFFHMGSRAFFWSSSDYNSNRAWRAWIRSLYYAYSGVSSSVYIMIYGFSVRCVKD